MTQGFVGFLLSLVVTGTVVKVLALEQVLVLSSDSYLFLSANQKY